LPEKKKSLSAANASLGELETQHDNDYNRHRRFALALAPAQKKAPAAKIGLGPRHLRP
jgi:hypothetical protein